MHVAPSVGSFMWYSAHRGQKKGTESPGAEVTDSCESPDGVVGTEPGFSARAVLILTSAPSLQSLGSVSVKLSQNNYQVGTRCLGASGPWSLMFSSRISLLPFGMGALPTISRQLLNPV